MKKIIGLFFFCLAMASCTSAPSNTQEFTDQPVETAEAPVRLEPTSIPTDIPATPTKAILQGQSPLYYIDLSLPGANPQALGTNFFTGSFHSAPVLTPDMKTMWWAGAYGSATIYTSHFEDGGWSEPATVQFSDSIRQYRDPFISPDGQRFFFISPDKIPGISPTGKENIWMMEKDAAGWSKPQTLPQSINALDLHWTVSVDTDYNLYFSAGETGNKDIYMSPFIDGEYADPVHLDGPINTAAMEITPNIAPDGSYLIFSRYNTQDETALMFISYATESGWSEAVQVGNVSYCISPIVTPDGKYVLYLSSPASFGWRDTSFIEENRPK